ncbi:MAG TPA: polysaccharide biosynthesis C-terminal domain-containing protein [Propionibacteriaceae bacterium]|nr:polysaccharide biosynthesis C-terminal domain-containing protein [Propionibacteriaceae bacterium]
MAAATALLPGFAFPFVLSWFLGAGDADQMLLAGSVALTLTSVVGNAVELNSVSELGGRLGQSVMPDRQALRRYRARITAFVCGATLVVGSLLIAFYGAQRGSFGSFAPLALTMLSVPLLGGIASARSGELLARGYIVVPVLLQSCRTVVPIVLLVLNGPQTPLALLAAGFAAGELVRLAVLTAMSRTRVGCGSSSADIPTNGLYWQSGSALTSQTGPITDRFFLSTAPAGALSSYEMADKLFFAAVQLISLGFLTRRLTGWAQLPTMEPTLGRSLLRTDGLFLLIVSTVAGLLGSLTCALTPHVVQLPVVWRQGFLWAQILFLSIPFTLATMCCSRLLIIARRQRLLIRFALLTGVGNALLDWIFFTLYGAVGIAIATVVLRVISAATYAIVLRRVLPPIIGSESQ